MFRIYPEEKATLKVSAFKSAIQQLNLLGYSKLSVLSLPIDRSNYLLAG